MLLRRPFARRSLILSKHIYGSSRALRTISCYMAKSQSSSLPSPVVSNERVAQFVKASYPVNPQSIQFLGGFDDYNYYIRDSAVGSNETKEYVFKLMVEKDINFFDAVTKLMLYLSKEGVTVSLPVKCIDNNTGYTVRLKKSCLVEERVEEDMLYTELLLTYLPGRLLSQVQRSSRLLYNIGEFVGNLRMTLQKFSHPYFETRRMDRDLKHFLDIRGYMKYADVAEEREHLEYAFKVYSEHVQQNLPHFQKGTVHNDLNADNFVCTNDGEFLGLIDFSDAVSSCTVFDGAIFIAYMMMLDCTNPLEYAKPAIMGYLSTASLNEQEFDSLYYLVVCHLTQSTLHALRNSVIFPENPYRTRTLTESRTALKTLLKTPKHEADRMWRSAQQKGPSNFV